ncbi:MAG: hypothetical protein KAR20_20585 [Candidatus Heimdallarchaeota archaeon]|nr:hypothetical protein [Candidatus Heimdallarchaeota archaeon]
MKRHNEALNTLNICFNEIETLMAIISNRLECANVPVEALFVEYWPIFMSKQIMYKVWNGIEHLVPINGKHVVPSMVTADDILEIVKRREILYRGFS